MTKPLAPERDAQTKIADKPSTQAVITKNHATSHRVAVRTPSQPLPHGTPAKHDNSAKEPKSKAAQAAIEFGYSCSDANCHPSAGRPLLIGPTPSEVGSVIVVTIYGEILASPALAG